MKDLGAEPFLLCHLRFGMAAFRERRLRAQCLPVHTTLLRHAQPRWTPFSKSGEENAALFEAQCNNGTVCLPMTHVPTLVRPLD